MVIFNSYINLPEGMVRNMWIQTWRSIVVMIVKQCHKAMDWWYDPPIYGKPGDGLLLLKIDTWNPVKFGGFSPEDAGLPVR